MKRRGVAGTNFTRCPDYRQSVGGGGRRREEVEERRENEGRGACSGKPVLGVWLN